MSKISIFALGGLGENGKNLYVVEVDSKIIILDAGSKHPPIDMFGVDSIIPDFSYLIERKDQVQGIFLSDGRDTKIGAVPELLNHFRVNVYASNFTTKLLLDQFSEEDLMIVEKYIKPINDNEVIDFGEVKVSAFYTTHALPESMGFAIHTKDGVIMYTGDYTFNTHVTKPYRTNFDRITEIAKENILLLMSDSVGCTYPATGDSNYYLKYHLNEVMQNAGRVIISAFSTELDKLQIAIDVAIAHGRNIAIIGRKAQRTVDLAVTMGYLEIPKANMQSLKFIDNKNDNYDDNMVVLVTGERHEPYFMLQRIARKRDKLVHIDGRDTVIIMTVPLSGVEKMAANTIDILYQENAKVKTLERKTLRGSHASQTDTKMMYTLTNPKYVMPVLGEYRHLYAQEAVAQDFGFDEDHILMLDNGLKVTFIDGVKQDKIEEIPNGDRLIDGSMVGDLNEVVLKDRETLGRDGVLMIIGNIDARRHKVVSTPEIVVQGFVLERENPQLFDELKELFVAIAHEHFKEKYVDWNILKSEMKDNISKYLYKQVNRSTLVIPVLIDTVTS